MRCSANRWGYRGLSGWMIVGCGLVTTAAAADPAATLASKGLTKSGKYHVVAGEATVLARWREIRPVVASSIQLSERQSHESDTATRLTSLEEERLDSQHRLAELNQQILEQSLMQAGNRPGGSGSGFVGMGTNASMGFGGSNGGNTGMGFGGGGMSPLQMERDQIRQDLAEIANEQRQLKANSVSLKSRAELDDQAKRKQDQARKGLSELRTLITEVEAKYASLDADPEVKKAKVELAQTTKTVVKLGPSEAYASAVRAIRQAEKTLGEEPTPSPSTSRKSKKAKTRR